MTELHNMSVAPRSMLTLQRAELQGRRLRVALGKSAVGYGQWPDDAELTRYFREDGAACALAVLTPGVPLTAAQLRKQTARFRRTNDVLATVRARCDAALSRLHLPDGFGFFVDDPQGTRVAPLSIGATLAILAARSGPLYLPGRFEPSLITAAAVTLYFPSLEEGRGVR